MDIRHVILLAVMAAVVVAIFMSLWLAALYFRKPELKKLSFAVSLCGVAIWGATFFAVTSNGVAPEYRQKLPGTVKGRGPAISEVPYPVTNTGLAHDVTVNLLAFDDQPAAGMQTVVYRVVDASGKEIATGQDSVGVKDAKQWLPARFGFRPERMGEHRLFLTIPAGVDMYEIVINESRD